jgi:hypothetical protein
MSILSFSDIIVTKTNNYLIIGGKIETKTQSQTIFDLTNTDTNPVVIITNQLNYDKIKRLYSNSSYPKANRDINIYGFDGIKYCKITSDSGKDIEGVPMPSVETPKFLSEIIFPTEKFKNASVYITFDHYNIYQTINDVKLQNKLINKDLEDFYSKLNSFYDNNLIDTVNIELIVKDINIKNYLDILTSKKEIKTKISVLENLIYLDQSNYILESILGKIIYGNKQVFQGFLSTSSNFKPIYVDTFKTNIDNQNIQLISSSIIMTMRTDTIQVQGNDNAYFTIIYEYVQLDELDKLDKSDLSICNKISIIEKNLNITLFESDNLANNIIQNNDLTVENIQLIHLIQFKNKLDTLDSLNSNKCEEFYNNNMSDIIKCTFMQISSNILLNDYKLNPNIFFVKSLNDSSKKILNMIKEKFIDISNNNNNNNIIIPSKPILHRQSNEPFNNFNIKRNDNFIGRNYTCTNNR